MGLLPRGVSGIAGGGGGDFTISLPLQCRVNAVFLFSRQNSRDYNQLVCLHRAGLIAEILPSVRPHSAGLLAGIGWKGRLSPRYFSGGGGEEGVYGYK